MIRDFAMLTMAVRDADAAAADYQAMFGMEELAKGDSKGHGVRRKWKFDAPLVAAFDRPNIGV